ncbi:MAG TPA: serine/threonine-protein kinase, partial [Holophagaceae bacterium]
MIRPIGSGGMGTVYLAEDPLLKRRVAIKVVKVSGEARNQAMLRFRREAEISAQLNHPNVITVYDVGVEEDIGPFLAMEYIEGKSLARHIKEKSLDLDTSARVLVQAMRALRAAHRSAIVHRDVKPDNILLSEEGRAKLMDFGIARSLGHMSLSPERILDAELAPPPEESTGYVQTLALRLTVTGDFLGSPAYAAPEVLKGGEGTPASDRYSFAATAFELLTGRLPHPGNGLTEIIVHALQDPVAIPPDMPPSLAAVFQRALAMDPDD